METNTDQPTVNSNVRNAKSLQTAVDFFISALDRDINSYEAKRQKNRQRAFIVKIAVAALGATTTIFVGIQSNELFNGYRDILSVLALVTSASVTLFSTWEAFYDHRWLWVTYTSTLAELRSIKSDIEYIIARDGHIEKKELDALYSRRIYSLQQTNSQWSQKRASDRNVDEKPSHPSKDSNWRAS